MKRVSLDVLNVERTFDSSNVIETTTAAKEESDAQSKTTESTVNKVEDNVLDMFNSVASTSKPVRSSFIPDDDYEQVSVHSILSRLRPQQKESALARRGTNAAYSSTTTAVPSAMNASKIATEDESGVKKGAQLSPEIATKASAAVSSSVTNAVSAEKKHSNAASTAAEGGGYEAPRIVYTIEVPKTGMLERDEYLTPLYLPTACNEESATSAGSVKDTASYTTEDFAARANAIKTMVYCYDSQLMAYYKEQNRTVGINLNWGLSFESRFECGNLFRADSVIPRGQPLGGVEEYELYVHPDPSLSLRVSHSQWFFFRISNTRKCSYRFHIVNLNQRLPALEQGMRPVMLSETNYKEKLQGWTVCGEDISFVQNSKKNDPYDVLERMGNGEAKRPKSSGKNSESYTFSFTVTFAHAKDTVYIALTPPYTYTQLQNMIYLLTRSPDSRTHLRVTPLCRTLAGNRCDLLTITENCEFTKDPALEREEMEQLERQQLQAAAAGVRSGGIDRGAAASLQVRDSVSSPGGMALSPAQRLKKRLQRIAENKNGAVAFKDTSTGFGVSPTASPIASSKGANAAAATSAGADQQKLPRFLQKIQDLIKSEDDQGKKKLYEENRKKFVFITAVRTKRRLSAPMIGYLSHYFRTRFLLLHVLFPIEMLLLLLMLLVMLLVWCRGYMEVSAPAAGCAKASSSFCWAAARRRWSCGRSPCSTSCP